MTTLQRFLRSFSGTGTWTKFRFRHKTGTDRNQVIQNRHRKELIMAFLRPVLAGPLQSVLVLCQYRHFVLVPVPLTDRKKRCILKKNIFFSSIFQKFLQLEKYSRWKINIQSIFGQHKILYKKIKKNMDFEIL
jgi:hypothetical protein